MAVNLDALFHCCQAALPDLLSVRAARIVTVASTAGLKGYAYTAPYVAAKHGAIGLKGALAAEFAKSELTVNAVCPGYVNTPMTDSTAAAIVSRTGRSHAEAVRALEDKQPIGRLIEPEEVAAMAVYLAGEMSKGITGQAINIDGGGVMS